MANDQDKVIEIGNTTAEDKPAARDKTEWEKTLEAMMKRAYINGLSHGMKTMCGSILSKMNECQKQRMNPQKQIIELRKWCNQCLAKVNEPPKVETNATTDKENKTED